MAQIDEIKKARLDKLQAIKSKGINPYASKFDKKHDIAYALSHEGEQVKTAGKLMSFREHGDITFADLKDVSGKIQLFLKKDTLGDEQYENLKLMDAGDYVGVEGIVGKTQAGEISIIPEKITLLTKSMVPHPNEWYGLKDVETRYRKRYVDLLMNDEVKELFRMRTKVITLLRTFLDEHGFMEVETPILQPLYGGAYAKPFTTHYNALDSDFYLRIAVELYLKRLLVGGFEKVYEIGKNFRNEGFSRAHNPEFTMLEFYWAYKDHEDLMDFTEEMFVYLIKAVKGSLTVESDGQAFHFKTSWPRKTYRELFIEHASIDINRYTTEEALGAFITEKNLLDEKVVGYGQMLDELYKKHVRPHLKGPMFVTEYPLEIKALAKQSEKDPTKAASFQLLINGVEMINAYDELNDPVDQQARWEEEMKLAKRGGEDYQVLDEDYIEALSYGMPPTAGWGMGIDRLVAFLTDQHAIKDVILFPTMRPESHDLGELNMTPEEGATVAPANVQSVQSVPLKMTREQGLQILEENIQNKNLRNHCKAVEATMRALAQRLDGNEEVWAMAGLLHDTDWEETQSDPSQHTRKTIQRLKDLGEDNEELINLILTHNHHHNGHRSPESLGEWALYTCDELTGFIVAVTLVRPDRKLEGVEVSSVLKKFPAKSFAQPVDREQIKLCEEKLGIPLKEFVGIALEAMKGISSELGL